MSSLSGPAQFDNRLLRWARELDRPLPWRGEKDPYRIWLSEVLLQQTRAEAVVPYYQRFLEHCPDVFHMAATPRDKILKLWEGLGYYNRAHNLHETAIRVARDREGVFPNTYQELLQLPGVGPYTAAAIASFAFGRSHAVLDGNVIRLLTRLSGLTDPVHRTRTKRDLQQLADSLMGSSDPATFNQAIMDFGAVHCRPRDPRCESCPFQPDCLGYRSGNPLDFPVKPPRKPLRDRYFLFFDIRQANRTWLVQRDRSDVWRQLFTFPLVELSGPPAEWNTEVARAWSQLDFPLPVPEYQLSPPYRQVLSHQRLTARFVQVSAPTHLLAPDDWHPVEGGNFTTFALPRIIRSYLDDETLYLSL